MRFLILLAPGQNWREDVIFHNQPFMPEHAVYVQEAFNHGKVILAGPYADLTGGAIVIDAENEDEIQTFIEHDPTVKNRIFTYQIKRWGEGMSKFENISPNFDQGYIDYKHKVQKELKII
ncbi:hypothetical protein KHA93_21440 [Bacillus sp. FJAT-49732]|uniref:YCII-related domain-containing protein n=1 Tax=Lederbergia citrisecunda TaxID=2833583 RepID=A0A942TTW6_9BACI|nr:YciI family protein [Lederbergia citrisecunda]MBS4202177.1 hypothetical protein [Lederbergia citrisecunda]